MREAIGSILEQTKGLDYEVIIVDNNSADDSLHMINTCFLSRSKKIRVIKAEENLGFARANNLGIKIATGRNILFLNPDTKLRNNAIKQLSDYLDAHTKVGAAAGNLFTPEGGEQFSYWPLLPGARFEWNELTSNIFLDWKEHGSLCFNRTGQAKEVGYVIGADMMVRHQVIDEVGTFDEDFFLFYEETELCYRIKRAGYKIMSIPRAEIIHLESQAIGNLIERQKYMMPSRKIYMNKCLSKGEYILADCLLAINCIVRLTWFTIISNKEKQYFWKYRLQNI